ncbi:early endosome antigen 1-like [Colias croceus]|uniref:early endosome antigen 1-like n=1 Tax=Colias crocea TaxID=72248 RepID=UPI001E279FEE|nr:early endosome antigen 1-like [Colias croceus]XP_045495335.1 early endosome antigen 1-like [Colias croceus]XP_045495336.1 early endosome antigen 1-like [Colias croceus]
MPENTKMAQSASPVARSGGGDISEREFSRERHNLYSTPPTRVQRIPRKQLFSAPVNKFTANTAGPTGNLARIRSCLDEYATPKRAKIGPKAASMEDLTPNIQGKRNRRNKTLPIVRSPGLLTATEEQAAAKIARFVLVAAWRRRRGEVRCLRKTLEFQVTCSERLRIQVCALKSLLDSDNAKVRLAMKEIERLKQVLKDKDIEKTILEREKIALEQDVCAVEDRLSELSIGWRNTRNELEGARAAAASAEHALLSERAALRDARAQRDHAYRRISILEDDLTHHESLLSAAEEEAAALQRDVDEKKTLLEDTQKRLQKEILAREQYTTECAQLKERVSLTSLERDSLGAELSEVRANLASLERELRVTREQLEWWPKPLTRMLGAARSWLRRPLSLSEALMWSLVPARHGC